MVCAYLPATRARGSYGGPTRGPPVEFRLVPPETNVLTSGDRSVLLLPRMPVSRKERVGLLASAAQHYAAIVESSDDAILSKDLKGVILSWNQGAERLFGYAAEEAIGQPAATLFIPPDRRNEELELLERDSPRRRRPRRRNGATAQGRKPRRYLPDHIADPGSAGPDRRRIDDCARHNEVPEDAGTPGAAAARDEPSGQEPVRPIGQHRRPQRAQRADNAGTGRFRRASGSPLSRGRMH